MDIQPDNAVTPTRRTRRMARQPAPDSNPSVKQPTKASLVEGLLEHADGASLVDLCHVTGWQPHTTRAFLSGLRKRSRALERAKREDGTAIYRLASVAEAG
jgi:hypothetical protein